MVVHRFVRALTFCFVLMLLQVGRLHGLLLLADASKQVSQVLITGCRLCSRSFCCVAAVSLSRSFVMLFVVLTRYSLLIFESVTSAMTRRVSILTLTAPF